MSKVTNPCPFHPDEEIRLYGVHHKPGSKIKEVCDECWWLNAQDEHEALVNAQDY